MQIHAKMKTLYKYMPNYSILRIIKNMNDRCNQG